MEDILYTGFFFGFEMYSDDITTLKFKDEDLNIEDNALYQVKYYYSSSADTYDNSSTYYVQSIEKYCC